MILVGIYRIYNIFNKKCYIGSSSNLVNRISLHKCSLRKNEHYNAPLQNDFNNYGEDAFEFQILLICKRKKLLKKEAKLMKKFKALKKGYNVQEVRGTYKSFIHSEEAKAKMKGNTNATGNKGRVFSLESRQLMSIAATNRKNSGMSGKTHSDETKAKMSATKLARKLQRQSVA